MLILSISLCFSPAQPVPGKDEVTLLFTSLRPTHIFYRFVGA